MYALLLHGLSSCVELNLEIVSYNPDNAANWSLVLRGVFGAREYRQKIIRKPGAKDLPEPQHN